jgi:hypothetical protein
MVKNQSERCVVPGKSVFKNILQVGIVVRDLDDAVRKYEETWGIGPWRIFTYDKSNMRETKGSRRVC